MFIQSFEQWSGEAYIFSAECTATTPLLFKCSYSYILNYYLNNTI